jgi:hypothetical protein
MARKQLKRQRTGLVGEPGRHDQNGDAGLLGGPTTDSGLFEAPDRSPGEMPGLLDARDRSPGEMPGLFDLRRRLDGNDAGPSDKPARPPAVGLFDKPPRRK